MTAPQRLLAALLFLYGDQGQAVTFEQALDALSLSRAPRLAYGTYNHALLDLERQGLVTVRREGTQLLRWSILPTPKALPAGQQAPLL